MKKKFCLLLAAVLSVLCLAACGGNDDKSGGVTADVGTVDADTELIVPGDGESKEDIGFDDDSQFTLEYPDGSDEPDITENVNGAKDFYGALDGYPMSPDGTDWHSSFGAAGWELNKFDEGVYSFISLGNVDYSGCEVYLYPVHPNENGRATCDAIQSGGFSGYHVAAGNAEVKPDMTFNGLSFGASADDVIAAYGEPVNTYECDTYVRLTYRVAERADMEFYVYSGTDGSSSGLQTVDLMTY